MERLGAYIKNLRLKRELPLRKVAAYLDIDTSTLSKIEKGSRYASKENIEKLSELFSISQKELFVTLLSDKIADELINQDSTEQILRLAEKKIKFIKSKKYQTE